MNNQSVNVENGNRKMDAGYHFKKEADSKNHTSRGTKVSIMMYVALFCGIMLSIAMSGCNKDKEDDHLAPVGTIAPPKWLIGHWVLSSSTLGFDFYTVTSDSIKTFGLSLNFTADLANSIAQIVGGTVKMKEIKKTKDEYEVGTITTSSSGSGTINPNYWFKNGDGTYIEVAKYDSQNKKWYNFQKYNKETR